MPKSMWSWFDPRPSAARTTSTGRPIFGSASAICHCSSSSTAARCRAIARRSRRRSGLAATKVDVVADEPSSAHRHLKDILGLIDQSRLGSQKGLKRWVMAEVPSILHRIPDYAEMGIEGVSQSSDCYELRSRPSDGT